MDSNTVTISKTEYEELKSNSLMLGQIGCFVESFLQEEEDTTFNAVVRLLIKYHEREADYLYHILEKNAVSKK